MIGHLLKILLGTFLVQVLIFNYVNGADLYNEIQGLNTRLDDADVSFLNNQISKDFSTSNPGDETDGGALQEGDLSSMLGLGSDDLKTVNKRTLSVDGGLRTLAQMVYSQERARRHGYMANLFRQKGKRSWRFPLMGLNFLKLRTKPSKVDKSIMRRRTNHLSVSGPLSALANMLAEEGRQRKQSQSMANRMKLIELGKRNDETYNPFEDEHIENSSTDLSLDLYR